MTSLRKSKRFKESLEVQHCHCLEPQLIYIDVDKMKNVTQLIVNPV